MLAFALLLTAAFCFRVSVARLLPNDEPGDGKIKQATTFISQKGETADIRKLNYQESLDWYAGIVADIFG